MERKQFTFTGLNWMKPEQVQEVRKQLLKLEDYGIKFKFELHNDTQLIIYDYDEVLLSPNDESAETFVKKFKNETEESSDGNDYKLCEDCLLIFTISDDMNNDGMNINGINIAAKLVTFWGDVQEIQL
jgi:hypothetical protein